MAEKDPCKVQLKDVRLSYPNLFTPKAFARGEGKPAYSASFLIPKDTPLGKKLIKQVEAAIEAAKEKEWGEKIPKIKKANIAYDDGDVPEDDEEGVPPELEGMMVVRSRNYKRPLVLDRDKTDLDESDGRPYGGCYVDAIVRFWAQTYENTKRVNCSLEAVRFRRDGEPFGAAPVDPDEFDDIEDEDDEEDTRSSKKRRSRDDDEDERPSKKRRSRDDDDDEDERPSKKRRSRDDDDDEDEDERPSKKRRSRDEDDEDEDERPSKKRRSRDDDDEEEDRPSRNSRSRRRSRDDDDDDI